MLQIIIYIYDEKYLEDILMALNAVGVHNAIVSEGLSMQNVMAYQVPIFAGLRSEISSSPKFCKIIFAATDDKNTVDDIYDEIKETGIDNKKKKVFSILSFPVNIKE